MSAEREQFLARRRAGIGGSDLAAVLGLSPYKSPFQLWLEKTGRDQAEPTPEQAERMHWGTVLEDVVARHYAEQCGCKVQRINAQLQHKDWPVIIANVDRVRVTEGTRARWDAGIGKVLGAEAVLEVKTASAYALRSDAADDHGWGEPGTDQVPIQYWAQVQQYLGVTGLPWADLAVLFGGQKFATYTITSDAKFQGDAFAQATDWWDRYVAADLPPAPQSEAEARLAWAAHRPGKSIQATDDMAAWVDAMRAAKAAVEAAKTQEQELRDLLLPTLEDAECLEYMGRTLATFKANKDSVKTDWKAVAQAAHATPDLISKFTTTVPGSRVLRLITPKE